MGRVREGASTCRRSQEQPWQRGRRQALQAALPNGRATNRAQQGKGRPPARAPAGALNRHPPARQQAHPGKAWPRPSPPAGAAAASHRPQTQTRTARLHAHAVRVGSMGDQQARTCSWGGKHGGSADNKRPCTAPDASACQCGPPRDECQPPCPNSSNSTDGGCSGSSSSTRRQRRQQQKTPTAAQPRQLQPPHAPLRRMCWYSCRWLM